MHKSVWIVLVIVSLLAVGCGPAVQTAAGPETTSGEVFMLALPRIEIQLDAEGYPSILGLKLVDIGRAIGQDLSALKIDKSYVDLMTAANVQHIELRAIGNGIVLFANGKTLPYIAWDEESLKRVGDITGLIGINGDLVKMLAPFIRRLGLDVAVKFPLSEGAQAVPYASDDPTLLTPKPEDTRMVKMAFEVKFDERGVPAILGVSTEDLAAAGIALQPSLVSPAMLQQLQGSNIQYLELCTKADGLIIYVNGKPLPNIVWDNTFLNNAAELYAQMFPKDPLMDVIKQAVPALDNTDIAAVAHFPLAAGAEPVPIETHCMKPQ